VDKLNKPNNLKIYKSSRSSKGILLSLLLLILFFTIFVIAMIDLALNKNIKIIILIIIIIMLMALVILTLLNSLAGFIIFEHGISVPIKPFESLNNIKIVPYSDIFEFSSSFNNTNGIITLIKIHTKTNREITYIQRGNKNNDILKILENALMSHGIQKVNWGDWQIWNK